MRKGIHKFAIWNMPLLAVFFSVGTIMAGIFPPPSPLLTADQVVARLEENLTMIRIGLVICSAGCAFSLPFAAVLAREVQKMTDGGLGLGVGRNYLADIQLAGTVILGFTIQIPMVMFMATTFNMGHDPELIKSLYDMSFLFVVAPASMGTSWLAFLGFAMLLDRQEIKTFPRWLAYFTLFVAFDFAGSIFCVLTKTGPFAYDGIISYWIPFGTWGAWAMAVSFYMLRSHEREYAQPEMKALEQ